MPSAIDILTTVDYFAVGSRQACFTKLAPQLAKHDFQLYGKPLIGRYPLVLNTYAMDNGLSVKIAD